MFGITNEDSEAYKVAQDLENRIYNETDSTELKSFLTSLGLLYVHKVFKDEDIVFDRHLLSNFSYNGNELSLPIFKAMLGMGIYPDIVFILYASLESRIERIKKRNTNDSDLYDMQVLSQKYDKIFEFCKSYNLPYYVIDTENKTEDEVYAEVKKIFEEEKKENGNIKPSREYKSYTKCYKI